jgi:hypothetical protein
MLAVPIVVSCGGSSDAGRVGRYSGIWRGTLTEGGHTFILLIDQRQTGTKTKGYARVIDGDTIHGGILRGQASASGYTGTVDFGGTTGTVSLTASGDDASVQMVATGGNGILRDARGSMTNNGVGPSPAGTWTIAWTDDFDNTGSFDIEIALVDGGYEVLPQEIDLPGLSGYRNLDISVIGLDVVFKSVLTVYEQNSVINWSIPSLGGNGVFQGILVGPDDPVEVNGPCVTSRRS